MTVMSLFLLEVEKHQDEQTLVHFESYRVSCVPWYCVYIQST